MKPDPRTVTMRSEAMPVGDGYAVTFSYVRGRLDAEWSPDVPSGRIHLTPAYQRARTEFMQQLARRLDGKLMVVEA